MIKRVVKIKYHNKDYKIQQHGEWMDLAVSKDFHAKDGKFQLLDLGVSMKLPKWYGAMVIPRSSTCKNWGLIQANSVGLIDNSYCGESDVWQFPAIPRFDITIPKNTRLCQFTIVLNRNAPWYIKILDLFTTFKFKEVDVLTDVSRNGFGSTGL